eukprot:scaffold2151_cov237-Skeletonema_marinoi.AAC.3
MAAVSLGLTPGQGVYSHAYGFTINLVLLWLRRCSVSHPFGVSILNLTLMTLPLIWFCYGVYSRSHARSGCLFSISRLWFYH